MTVPLIAHVVYRFDYGGLENGLVNLINSIPSDHYHHAIICLTDYSDFAERITNPKVRFYALNKKSGNNLGLYWKLYRLFRQIKPQILHTRNLAALESVLPAVFAGVAYRIHGEHGRDVFDLYGENWKYNLFRQFHRPLIHQYIALSKDLQQWLSTDIGVKPEKLNQIYNGVDSKKFSPRPVKSHQLFPANFMAKDTIIIGTVGRLAEVKDPLNLLHGFYQLRHHPKFAQLRLVFVGHGCLYEQLKQQVQDYHFASQVWLAGCRSDIADLMNNFDIFVLPSKGEGISNTILEAMACGLPVVATDVGGNRELVQSTTGQLVVAADPKAIASALQIYIDDPVLRIQHAGEARVRIEQDFSLSAMVSAYLRIYQKGCQGSA